MSLETELVVGEHLSYPSVGIVKVKRIEIKEVGGKKKLFAVCESIAGKDYTGRTVIFPADPDSLLDKGIRPLVSSDEAEEIRVYLKSEDAVAIVSEDSWNRRYREYMELIQTGDLRQIAFVQKALTQRSKRSDLSFGERKMLELASNLTQTELNLALSS